MSEVRVAATLLGDIQRRAEYRVKYGFFFEALRCRFPLAGMYDASLRGLARLVNAVRVFHPDRRRWRERFAKNVPAFTARSRGAAAFARRMRGQADVLLQLGVLFDAHGDLPSVIYTDYTAALSARFAEGGRSPFTPRARERWLAMERQALQRAKHVCSRTEFVRRSLLEDYDLRPERVSVVGGGVNLPALPPVEPKPAGGPPTALFIGKEFHRKGGDVLLQAFAMARADVPQARLIMLTAGPLPASLPAEGIEVIAPTWDREVIAGLFRQADVFVLPSRLETWGDVLLEAMAFGRPCIGVTGQAMDEIIVQGQTGLLAPPGDAAALGQALARLLSNPDLCLAWGAAGRQRVEREFTWERVVERLGPALETVAKGG